MGLDYISIVLSLIIFIFYITIITLLLRTKKRLDNEAGKAFTYFIVAVVFLTIRRIGQMFLESQIVAEIPYFTDFVTLIFAILFFVGIYHMYLAIKEESEKKVSRAGKNTSSKNIAKKQAPRQKPTQSTRGLTRDKYIDLTK